jgi:hypothetical protein
MSQENEINNLINSTFNINNTNTNISNSLNLKDILISNINKSYSSSLDSTSINQESSSGSFISNFKSFIESIPQSFLLMCVLILFILFFILIIIILICLIKKRKRLLKAETIVNNNKIDINKMILQNSNNVKPNIKDFQAIQNNSNISDFSGAGQNMSLSEIKAKNLKEEIHSIVSGTLNEITMNKCRKMKRRKKGNTSRTNGQRLTKNENNNLVSSKDLDDEKKEKEKEKEKEKNDIIQ